jgi:hypothetical protein
MNDNNLTLASNRIFIVFLAIPIFIITWIKLNYFYAFVIGLGSAALLYVLFVVVPTDKLEKRLRKAKFVEARKTIKLIRQQIQKINRQNLKSDLLKACDLADGLVAGLEKQTRHQGKVEESILPLLNNMYKQVDRWLIHESGRRPLLPQNEEKLVGILLNYDTLFFKYQEGGIPADEFLTSLYHSETAMLELGIDINDLE